MYKSTSSLNRRILSLFTNRWAGCCFFALILMELISASSSLWLVKMMEGITSHTSFTPYLFCYLGSLLLPSIPWCFAFIFKTSWRQEAQRTFIQTFVAANRNHVGEWNNLGLKEQKMSILTAEGPLAINAFVDYAFDVCSYTFSVFFNIMALSIVVEPLFTVAFLISLITVASVMRLRKKTQRTLTKKALTARIDLSQQLLGAWDNVLLGNNYNFHLWEERTRQRMNRCLQKNVDLERFDQIMAIVVSLITMIPSLLVVVWFVFTHQDDTVALASFFVTIPILFLILSYTYQMLSNAFRWGMHKSKMDSLFRAIEPIEYPPDELLKKVKWPKIQYTRNESSSDAAYMGSRKFSPPCPISSHHDLIQHTAEPGRITLRGENGCGKSTTLMLIKNSLGDRAFILPTMGHLTFTSETNKHSTGENLRNRLVEILEKVDAPILLLDEWDANLDRENREILNELIDQIAEKKCVIEVRHR